MKPQQKPKVEQIPHTEKLIDRVNVEKLDWYSEYARKVREQKEEKK